MEYAVIFVCFGCNSYGVLGLKTIESGWRNLLCFTSSRL